MQRALQMPMVASLVSRLHTHLRALCLIVRRQGHTLQMCKPLAPHPEANGIKSGCDVPYCPSAENFAEVILRGQPDLGCRLCFRELAGGASQLPDLGELLLLPSG